MIAAFNTLYVQHPVLMTIAFIALGCAVCLVLAAWACVLAEWIGEWWFKRRRLF